MQKRIRLVFLLLIAAVNLFTVGSFLAHRGEYTLYFRDPEGFYLGAEAEFSRENVVELVGTAREDEFFLVTFRAVGQGVAQTELRMDSPERPSVFWFELQVNGIGTLFRTIPLDFSRWEVLWSGCLISMVLLCVLLFHSFRYRIKRDLYSYQTQQVGGIALFVLALTLLNAVLSVVLLPNYRVYSADMFLVYIATAFLFFTMATIPFVVGFGIALSLSNLKLIRKEGFRPQNLLGIGISLSLLSVILLGFLVPTFLFSTELIGHEGVLKLLRRVQYVGLGLFCFFLSFLLSTMICGLIAARRVPKPDADFIIILGCGIRKDGTLLPLLQGRADRAVAFWRQQLEATGKRAVFIPSGGKGSDECIAEGEAVRRYLLTLGIPEECIRPETASTTTLENMRFSKAIIDEEKPGARVVFSTTNYHVFRSGMLAGQAGLDAVGIGSRTRWYFWPNAFVREFVGLLYTSRRLELFLLGAAAGIFALCSFAL